MIDVVTNSAQTMPTRYALIFSRGEPWKGYTVVGQIIRYLRRLVSRRPLPCRCVAARVAPS